MIELTLMMNLVWGCSLVQGETMCACPSGTEVQMVSAGYGSLPALLYWNVKSLQNPKVCERCCSIREF